MSACTCVYSGGIFIYIFYFRIGTKIYGPLVVVYAKQAGKRREEFEPLSQQEETFVWACFSPMKMMIFKFFEKLSVNTRKGGTLSREM